MPPKAIDDVKDWYDRGAEIARAPEDMKNREAQRSGTGMHRYYFIVEMPDHTFDDLEGELLPSDAAAKDHGRRVVRELKGSDSEWACAVLHVRDETGQTIDSIPFWLF